MTAEGTAKQDIAEVLVRYATGIDRRDWDLFRSCFTADCLAEYGDIGTWESADAITDFMVTAHAGMGHTMHRISNIAIDVDQATATRAVARSYVDGILMAPDGQTGFNPIGFYDDQLVRTDDGWRIAHRTFTMVISAHFPIATVPLAMHTTAPAPWTTRRSGHAVDRDDHGDWPPGPPAAWPGGGLFVQLAGELGQREGWRPKERRPSTAWIVERCGVSLATARAFAHVAELTLQRCPTWPPASGGGRADLRQGARRGRRGDAEE